LLRLGTAAVLGSLIGLERQRLDKAAGLRTHMLVSVGSALVMIVSATGFEEVLQPGRVVLDPSRVAAQVVSGIGFLGVGLILRRNLSVHGLTTAASVWAVASIGLAAGGGLYLAATLATVLMLIILAVIKPVEDRLFGHSRHRTIQLVTRGSLAVTDLEPILRSHGLVLAGLHLEPGPNPGEQQVELTCAGATEAKLPALVDALKGVDGMRQVSYGLSGEDWRIGSS
jgi:putative Mg2+ transporter-C (MgtC) family protein